jgi:hypothetical protein
VRKNRQRVDRKWAEGKDRGETIQRVDIKRDRVEKSDRGWIRQRVNRADRVTDQTEAEQRRQMETEQRLNRADRE